MRWAKVSGNHPATTVESIHIAVPDILKGACARYHCMAS